MRQVYDSPKNWLEGDKMCFSDTTLLADFVKVSEVKVYSKTCCHTKLYK